MNHPEDTTGKRPVPGAVLLVHTPAKLNLGLRILGRRPDGYHDLETVMVSIGLYDSLLFRLAESSEVGLSCRFIGPSARSAAAATLLSGSPTRNLVVQAARLLQRRTGCGLGVDITLCKRIPLQSGLGGGSSDAAATLVALNRLWRLRLSRSELHALAAELGSDVNFFVDSPLAALCRGRGERVEPLRMGHRLHAVVVCPNSGLSTAAVFAEWSRTVAAAEGPEASLHQLSRALLEGGRLAGGRRKTVNDLEAPARRLSGDVDAILSQLGRTGGGAFGMSGSGAACFLLCRTAPEAKRLAARLRRMLRGSVFAVSSRT